MVTSTEAIVFQQILNDFNIGIILGISITLLIVIFKGRGGGKVSL